jgi:predicted CXXCH cytochrome family protein
LVAEVPQLCYKCHDPTVAEDGWVHGPVAAGDCLMCHEPHKTKNRFLLTKTAPSLCYECHEPEAVHLVEHHAEEAYAKCGECHEGHAGATRTLLRPAFLQAPAGADYLRRLQSRQYQEARERARADLAQGKDVLALLATIIGHVEAGEFWRARACLEVASESDQIADAERQRIAEILNRLASVMEAPPGDNQEAANAALREALRQEILSEISEMRDRRERQRRRIAELYYRSIDLYHAGRFAEAREGFLQVLESGPLLKPVRETAEFYLQKMEPAPDGAP